MSVIMLVIHLTNRLYIYCVSQAISSLNPRQQHTCLSLGIKKKEMSQRVLCIFFGCDSSPRSPNVCLFVCHTCYNCTKA